MKKIILIILIAFTLSSCGSWFSPDVEVINDINITIDGENLDGVQGEWVITSEDKKENGKEILVITIEKNNID